MMLQRSILAILLVSTWCQSLTSANGLSPSTLTQGGGASTDMLSQAGLSSAADPVTAALQDATQSLPMKRDNGDGIETSSSDGMESNGDYGNTETGEDLTAQSGKGIAMNSGRQSGGALETIENEVTSALKRRNTNADENKAAEEQSSQGHTSVSLLSLRRRAGVDGLGQTVSELAGAGEIGSTAMSGGSGQSGLLRRTLPGDSGSGGNSDQQKTASDGSHTSVSLLSLRRRAGAAIRRRAGAEVISGGGDLSSKFLGGGGETASQQSGSSVSLLSLRRRSPGKPGDLGTDDDLGVGSNDSTGTDNATENVADMKVKRSNRKRGSRFSRRSGSSEDGQSSGEGGQSSSEGGQSSGEGGQSSGEGGQPSGEDGQPSSQ